ncbi:hypothetical protein NG754_04955 [Aliarcobacter cryaerophilus]|uniref:hypothetical protein n=1 Tax=Aliarcobacter cryaerophilus TaxID=28198 RepID=UPI003DA5E635
MSVKNEGFLHLEFSMISSLNDSYRTIISVYGCDPLKMVDQQYITKKDFNDFLQRGELLNSIKKHLPSSQIDILDIKKYILEPLADYQKQPTI